MRFAYRCRTCSARSDKGWTYAKFLLNTERTHNAYLGILYRYLDRLSGFDHRPVGRVWLVGWRCWRLMFEAHEWSVSARPRQGQ